MSRFASDVIRELQRTEKGTDQLKDLKYFFVVDKRATKPEIRQAVEKLFQVKVASVHTAVVKGKPRRVGAFHGHKPSWKRAIVTLKEGSKIEVAQ